MSFARSDFFDWPILPEDQIYLVQKISAIGKFIAISSSIQVIAILYTIKVISIYVPAAVSYEPITTCAFIS